MSMTAKERRELMERLHREAEAQNLTIVRREQLRGKWVWGVYTRGGTPTPTARGMNLSELTLYLEADRQALSWP